FRVAYDAQMLFVQVLDQIQRPALHSVGNAGWIGEEKDRITGFAERDTLIEGGQKTAAVERRAAAETASGIKHDESWQILGFAAQAVKGPGAEAGSAELGRAGLHQHLARRMI